VDKSSTEHRDVCFIQVCEPKMLSSNAAPIGWSVALISIVVLGPRVGAPYYTGIALGVVWSLAIGMTWKKQQNVNDGHVAEKPDNLFNNAKVPASVTAKAAEESNVTYELDQKKPQSAHDDVKISDKVHKEDIADKEPVASESNGALDEDDFFEDDVSSNAQASSKKKKKAKPKKKLVSAQKATSAVKAAATASAFTAVSTIKSEQQIEEDDGEGWQPVLSKNQRRKQKLDSAQGSAPSTIGKSEVESEKSIEDPSAMTESVNIASSATQSSVRDDNDEDEFQSFERTQQAKEHKPSQKKKAKPADKAKASASAPVSPSPKENGNANDNGHESSEATNHQDQNGWTLIAGRGKKVKAKNAH